jgi:hypothetical protein
MKHYLPSPSNPAFSKKQKESSSASSSADIPPSSSSLSGESLPASPSLGLSLGQSTVSCTAKQMLTSFSPNPSSFSLLNFTFDVTSLFGMIVPDAFNKGIELAQVILKSKFFRRSFGEALDEISGDIDLSEFVLQLNKVYQMKLLQERHVITSYCAVYRETPKDFDSIYWNPLLLFNMLRKQKEAVDNNDYQVIQQCSLFIAAKLVHAVSHLLHFKCSKKLRDNRFQRTPQIILSDGILMVNKSTKKLEIVSKEVIYNDFGDILEKKLFGGLVEARYKKKDDYMNIESCAVFSSKANRYGNYVKCQETISSVESSLGEDCRFQLGDLFYSISMPSCHKCEIEGLDRCASLLVERNDRDVGYFTGDSMMLDVNEIQELLSRKSKINVAEEGEGNVDTGMEGAELEEEDEFTSWRT